jgi:GNAT superfamily N-acetyltransferase
MQIREVSPEEWERFRDVRLRALADSPSAFGSSLRREQRQPQAAWRERISWRGGGVTFAAVEDGAWLGIAGAYPDDDAPTCMWVVSMWVAPEARRRGAGRSLLDACVGWARERDAEEVRLWVTTTNTSARALYEAAGFEPTGATQPLPSDPSFEEEELRLTL